MGRPYLNHFESKWPDSVTMLRGKDKTTFTIIDDWGSSHTIIIDNIHKKEIEHAFNKAIEYGLMDRYNV